MTDKFGIMRPGADAVTEIFVFWTRLFLFGILNLKFAAFCPIIK